MELGREHLSMLLHASLLSDNSFFYFNTPIEFFMLSFFFILLAVVYSYRIADITMCP